jgi:hypothetical protein
MAYYSRYATGKKGCCPWSLVATTGHILALKLTASLRLMIENFFSRVEYSLDFP